MRLLSLRAPPPQVFPEERAGVGLLLCAQSLHGDASQALGALCSMFTMKGVPVSSEAPHPRPVLPAELRSAGFSSLTRNLSRSGLLFNDGNAAPLSRVRCQEKLVCRFEGSSQGHRPPAARIHSLPRFGIWPGPDLAGRQAATCVRRSLDTFCVQTLLPAPGCTPVVPPSTSGWLRAGAESTVSRCPREALLVRVSRDRALPGSCICSH